MEKRVWTRIGCLLGLFFIGIVSCKKSPPPKPIAITPLQTFVNSDTSLTLFHRMLLQANDAVLLADSSISLLIPTNAVLRQAGYTETIIDSTSSYLLDRMLRYQYVLSAIAPDSSGYSAYPTLLGATIYIQKDSGGQLLMNGSATANNVALPIGKASVYYLNSLLPPAADSLPELLQGDSTLSMFAEALAVTNLYDSTLLSGSYTILVPVNSAFAAAGYDSIPAIDSANIDTLFHLVQGQILKGIYFTNTFPAPGPVYDVLGNPITVGLANGGLQFSASGNAVPANWLSGNQVSGTNMVVHRTDAILSP
jgi:uncharacterized surface protein with fasciclin (FAS1) repeats